MISRVEVGVGNRGVGTGVGTGTAVAVVIIGVEVGVETGPLSTGVAIEPGVISITDRPGPGIRTEVAVGVCVGDGSGWTTGDAVGRASPSPPPHPAIAMIAAENVTTENIAARLGARPAASPVNRPLIPFMEDQRDRERSMLQLAFLPAAYRPTVSRPRSKEDRT